MKQNHEWVRPVDVIEEAHRIEREYCEDIEKIVKEARKHEDEMTVIEINKLHEIQIESVNQMEIILKKAR